MASRTGAGGGYCCGVNRFSFIRIAPGGSEPDGALGFSAPVNELLIIDDFGLKPRHPPADEDLHELIAERYESASTIVTSNLDLTEWDQAFPANRLLAATLDRLRHNAYCLVLDGHSYRSLRHVPQRHLNLANGSRTAHS